MWRNALLVYAITLCACSSLNGNVKYPMPSERYIDVHGSIDGSLTYKLQVQYVATNRSDACTNYNILAGLRVSQTMEFDYYPQINDGKHNLHVPLKELDPATECRWEPTVIMLCVGDTGTEPSTCSSVFSLRGAHANQSPVNMVCAASNFCFRTPRTLYTEAIDVFNTQYAVNITREPQ